MLSSTEKKAQNTKISSSLKFVSVHASSRLSVQRTTHGADYKANFPNRLLSTVKKIELQYILFVWLYYVHNHRILSTIYSLY